MNKMKRTTMLTLLCALLFGSGAFAQVLEPQPVMVTTITRSPCLPGFEGCSNDAIQLTLSNGAIGTTKNFTNNITHTYSFLYTRIKVSTPAGSSTGLYTLPTVTGDQVLIPSTDGILPYSVIITKTGARQYKLQVAELSL